MAYTSDFDEYKRLGEPSMLEKSEIWQTAIGLQQVDGLTPSEYLIKTAKLNIEGNELALALSVTVKTIKRDFTSLKNEGKIKRVGSDKTGHWEIIQ